jgi:two-component system, OmpR family, alkaline phosphatase synthesis response regulator PhoP
MMRDPITVLVVDDDQMIRSVVRIALQRVNDWTVIEAENGRVGVSVAADEQPDVILLDFQMPRMDGAQTISALKENPETSRLPVIFLTAKTGRRARGAYEQMGAVGTIEKPFDPLVLGEQILQLLNPAQDSNNKRPT